MKNVALFRPMAALRATIIGAAIAAGGCGSNSSVTATIPRTPTPQALRQVATAVPTATAIPDR
jgi:hypothetical protein